MRVARDLRSVLRIKRRRGYYRTPLRTGRARRAGGRHYPTAGGVIVGPRGARRWALSLVRSEIEAGSYVSEWRLNAALGRLLAKVF